MFGEVVFGLESLLQIPKIPRWENEKNRVKNKAYNRENTFKEVTIMSFAVKIAKIRLNYHATLADFGNGLNQLGLISDEKAEEFCREHGMKAIEAGARMHGLTLEEFLKKIEESGR